MPIKNPTPNGAKLRALHEEHGQTIRALADRFQVSQKRISDAIKTAGGTIRHGRGRAYALTAEGRTRAGRAWIGGGRR